MFVKHIVRLLDGTKSLTIFDSLLESITDELEAEFFRIMDM